MSSMDIVDLCSDDEQGEFQHVKAVNLERHLSGATWLHQENKKVKHFLPYKRLKIQSQDNRSSNVLSANQIRSSMFDQDNFPADEIGLSYSSPKCPAPICRQFWKAGKYDGVGSQKVSLQNCKNYIHVHPMFLHSNATSHRWAFGAIAELLDNAVDEIQNGAMVVIIDKISNPRDGSPALLIQDDGGGMDPETMRQCLSFGFSDKKSKSAIGQYGNGFKTSTMRLGADVIVFSRCQNKKSMQSISLLSYTFLSHAGHDRIVVPTVDYEFNDSSGRFEMLHGRDNFKSNVSLLLHWSPYSTESDLLKQFDSIGSHGTKVIIYNLWFNDDGNMELDFDTDPEDIHIAGDTREIGGLPAWRTINEQHIANQFHYSLRVYASILYMRVPENFSIVLRGKVIDHHNLATNLKFPECILYKPQSGGQLEAEVLTTIGFMKEAPQVSIHGFNVYHKNRLILPFWQVVSTSNSRSKGVVGVLEANFIKPTHNKQDFEKTSIFQKLEARLKDMTLEYWDYHCGLIGYQVVRKSKVPVAPPVSPRFISQGGGIEQPVLFGGADQLIPKKRRSKRGNEHGNLTGSVEDGKTNVLDGANVTSGEQSGVMQDINTMQSKDQEITNLLRENQKLQARCSEFKTKEEELNLKATQLRVFIQEVQCEYSRLLAELDSA